jgi:hypothetical protein
MAIPNAPPQARFCKNDNSSYREVIKLTM